MDTPDFGKQVEGAHVIDETSHIALAAPENNRGVKILRRGYNYTDGLNSQGLLDAGLLAAEASVGALVEGTQSAPMREALELTLYLVKRLRVGWNASGLWSADALEGADTAEVEAVEHELTHRLRAIERAALLRAG